MTTANTIVWTNKYLDQVLLWLYEHQDHTGGEGIIVSIIVQLLRSSTASDLLCVPYIQEALVCMVERSHAGPALTEMNYVMFELAWGGSRYAVAYLRTLDTAYATLCEPPFTVLDSTMWYYTRHAVLHGTNVNIT